MKLKMLKIDIIAHSSFKMFKYQPTQNQLTFCVNYYLPFQRFNWFLFHKYMVVQRLFLVRDIQGFLNGWQYAKMPVISYADIIFFFLKSAFFKIQNNDDI